MNTVNIINVLLEKAKFIYGEPDSPFPTESESKIAEKVFPTLLELILNGFSQEETLDFNNGILELDYEDWDQDQESEIQNSCSQEWEQLDIGNESFSLQQMKNIINFFDSKSGNKFKKTQARYPRVIHSTYISRFREYIANNGTKVEKLEKIEKSVKERFITARLENLCIHDVDLRRWAMESSRKFEFTEISLGTTWVNIFKRKNRIVSRKITKYVTITESENIEKTQEKAKEFVNSAKEIIEPFEKSRVLNADESGFTYLVANQRTLSNMGEKSTMAQVSSINAITHSHTAMPIISLNGKLLSPMLLCLQETDGKFGPTVSRKLFEAPNIFLTASKSGKLDKIIMEQWVKSCLSPNIKEKSLLFLDSWSGHKDDKIFESVKNKCEIHVIPPKTTSMIQPLDVYFFRQYKILRKRISDRINIDSLPIDLKNRNNIIKLHSLIHNQLSSEKFHNMIKYAWFKSGYTEEKEKFDNVLNICFETVNVCELDGCQISAMIKCSYCDISLCPHHFFEDNHTHFVSEEVGSNPENIQESFYESFSSMDY